MQISTKHGFAFLCMPKCASNSVQEAIKDYSNITIKGHPNLKHINARDAETYFLKFHRIALPHIPIETFCIIRDPLEWIESWYRYRTRDELKNPKNPSHSNYTGNVSYNEFIEAYISQEPRPPYAKIRRQFDFVRSDEGKIAVDHIFPIDDMTLLQKFLEAKIGEEISFRRKNVSPKVSVSLDPTLEARLVDYLKRDIELYNMVKEYGHFSKSLHANHN
ncbi:MAG: sulfotransferase family 2 domain-containing protein [Verrucomicrobiota bacterium]